MAVARLLPRSKAYACPGACHAADPMDDQDNLGRVRIAYRRSPAYVMDRGQTISEHLSMFSSILLLAPRESQIEVIRDR